MPQNTLLTVIISGAICLVIGFGSGALLTMPNREKTKSAITAIEAKAEKEHTIAQQEIKAAKDEIERLSNELKIATVELKQTNDELARKQADQDWQLEEAKTIARQETKTAKDEIERLSNELKIATVKLEEAKTNLSSQTKTSSNPNSQTEIKVKATADYITQELTPEGTLIKYPEGRVFQVLGEGEAIIWIESPNIFYHIEGYKGKLVDNQSFAVSGTKTVSPRFGVKSKMHPQTVTLYRLNLVSIGTFEYIDLQGAKRTIQSFVVYQQ